MRLRRMAVGLVLGASSLAATAQMAMGAGSGPAAGTIATPSRAIDSQLSAIESEMMSAGGEIRVCAQRGDLCARANDAVRDGADVRPAGDARCGGELLLLYDRQRAEAGRGYGGVD